MRADDLTDLCSGAPFFIGKPPIRLTEKSHGKGHSLILATSRCFLSPAYAQTGVVEIACKDDIERYCAER
jgi:hypothetical protein